MFKKVYIMYCPVCGYVDGEHIRTVCPFCGHELSNSNHLLKEMRGKFRWEIEPIAEDIFQELAKDNPEFNSTKYQLREGKEKERKRLADERVQRKWDAQKAEYEKNSCRTRRQRAPLSHSRQHRPEEDRRA